MTNKHKTIPEVQQYLETKSNDSKKQRQKRREICKIIINKSNRIYNEEIINNKRNGNPIPVKRGKQNVSLSSHVVCSVCGALITKRYFDSHSKTCKRRQIEFNNADEIETSTSVFLRPKLTEKYKCLEELVFQKMVKDNISFLAQSDPLIVEFGRRFLNSHMAVNQRNYVSNKMRTLADLLIRFKKADPVNIKSMADCVDPTNFDGLCKVIKHWSEYNSVSGVCAVGSVPRRICKSLKMCSYILWSEAIKDRTMSSEHQMRLKEKHDRFLSLMYSDWSVEINSSGDKSIKLHKVNKEDKMPLDDDLKTFFKESTILIENATRVLQTTHTLEDYLTLTKLCIAFLIAFNGRRPSEVVYAKIENFSNLKISSDLRIDNLSVFNVAALKNNLKVPVITPNCARIAIETLIEHRQSLNIKGDLLFGKPDGTAYNGSDLITKLKSNMTLENPKHLTANGMRHYWATISQKNPEIKLHMPKCLGHTVATHQRFYEMPLTDVHLNIVGPVLLRHCFSNEVPDASTNCFQNNSLPQPSTSQALSQSITSVSSNVPSTASSSIENDSNDGDLSLLTSSVDMDDSDSNETFENFLNIETDSNFEKNQSNLSINNLGISVIHNSKQNLEEIVNNSDTFPMSNENEHSSDDNLNDPDFNPDDVGCNNSSDESDFDTESLYRTPKKGRPSGLNSECNNSETEKSPILLGKRNAWRTPEREVLFNGLPKTILGLEHAGRGRIKRLWENSNLLKRSHSLQTTRIEVSKYYTKKKKIATPVRKRLLEKIGVE